MDSIRNDAVLSVFPQSSVDNANRIDRSQFRVILARIQLAGIQFATVEHDSRDQSAERVQLHFNVVNRIGLIRGLDVQNRQLVGLKVLQVVRIPDRDFDDRNRQLQNCIQQANQRQFVTRRAERLLERHVHHRTDANQLLLQQHDTISDGNG